MSEIRGFTPEEIQTGTYLLAQLAGWTSAKRLRIDHEQFGERKSEVKRLYDYCMNYITIKDSVSGSVLYDHYNFPGKIYLGAWGLVAEKFYNAQFGTYSFLLFKLAEKIDSSARHLGREFSKVTLFDQLARRSPPPDFYAPSLISKDDLSSYARYLALIRYAQEAFQLTQLGHVRDAKRLRQDAIYILTAVELALNIIAGNPDQGVDRILDQLPRDLSGESRDAWVAKQTALYQERDILPRE